MALVTIDTFDANKLTTGETMSALKPAAYQKIPILYKYEKGTAPLQIVSPPLYSIGVRELRDVKTDQLNAYSMGFHGFNECEGPTDKETKFMEVIGQIEQFCNRVVRANEADIVKKKKKPLSNEPMRIWRFNQEKPNAPPILFSKVFVDDKMTISSGFFRKKTKRDTKNIIGGNRVVVNPLNYLKQRCQAVACLKIDHIFINTIGEFIQVKLAEAVIVKKVESIRSIIGPDLDLGPEESGSESDDEPTKTEQNSDESQDETPKTKKEIVVRPKRPCPQNDDFEDEDDEDGVMEALKAAVKRHK